MTRISADTMNLGIKVEFTPPISSSASRIVRGARFVIVQ